jgi:SSS family solute:Na+ symporter
MGSSWLIDLAVVVGYFVLILGIGLYMGRREDSLHDFALGGRRIPWWAVLASIIAAETSAGTFFGTPGEAYEMRNFTYLQLAVGTILARVLVSYIFIKPYYQYNVYSIYEYLTARFGTATKNAASAVFLITRVLASGARIYVAAIALVLAYEWLSGTRPDANHTLLIYVLASVAITVLTAIYTTLGGIKAVIWTDFIQATIMMGSAVAALVILYRSIPGGWPSISAHLPSGNPLDLFFATGLDPARSGWDQVKGMFETEYTVFAIVGATFVTMATHGTDQDMVQRMLTAPDIRRSRMSLILSGLADIPIVLIFLSIGILLYAFYQAYPDPGKPIATNEMFCYFILHQLPTGMRGLLMAGIFSTAMGSLSTALNALATSFVRDWYQPYINPGAGEVDTLRAVRWATVTFAVLMIVVSSATSFFVIQRAEQTRQQKVLMEEAAKHPERAQAIMEQVNQSKGRNLRIIPIILGIFGYTYGSLLGVFFVGMLTKTRGNDFGNILGMIAGFVAVAILSGLPNDLAHMVGGQLYRQPDWLPVIEFPWRVMFGTIVTFLVAVCFRTPGPVSLARAIPVEPTGELPATAAS